MADTIDQVHRAQPPSEVVRPTRTDAVPQQASTQPGDGNEVHTKIQPGPNYIEVPADQPLEQPTRTDAVSQQASTQPGDGNEVHTKSQPGPNYIEVPADQPSETSPRLSFKEQVVGVAKKTRGTILGKPDLKDEGQKILEGKASAFSDEPKSV